MAEPTIGQMGEVFAQIEKRRITSLAIQALIQDPLRCAIPWIFDNTMELALETVQGLEGFYRAFSLAELSKNVAEVGKTEQAVQIAEGIDRHWEKERADALAFVGVLSGRNEYVDKARRLAQGSYPEECVLLAIARNTKDSQDLESARKLISDMSGDDSRKPDFLTDLATISHDPRDIAEANAWCARLSQRGFFVEDNYAVLVGVLVEIGEIEEARKRAHKIRSVKERLVAWISIAMAKDSPKDLERARKIAVFAAKSSGDRPEVTARCLLDIAEISQDPFDLDRARTAIGEISNEYLRQEALANLAVFQARNGRLSEAHTVVKRMTNGEWIVVALARISVFTMEASDIEDAFHRAKTITDSTERARALIELLKSMAKIKASLN